MSKKHQYDQRLYDAAIAVKKAVEANPLSREHPTELVPDLKVGKKRLLPVFKQEIGLKFKGFQIKVRLEFASKILLTGKDIKETAIECGYKGKGCVAHFSRDFKQVFEVGPEEWLKQQLVINNGNKDV